MVLWAKPIPKKLLLHDTRHTTATLLLAGGADLYAVARILRHTDPRVTFETYARLVPGYLHDQVDKLSALVPDMRRTSFPSIASVYRRVDQHPSSSSQNSPP